MKDKTFNQIFNLINIDISDTYGYFSIHNALFERKAQKLKAGSYGGYEVNNLVGEFNKAVNDKSSELLDKITNRRNKWIKNKYKNIKVELTI